MGIIFQEIREVESSSSTLLQNDHEYLDHETINAMIGNPVNEQTVKTLQDIQKDLRRILQTLPASYDNIKQLREPFEKLSGGASHQTGNELKQKGLEIGQLQNQVSPLSPTLEEKINGAKADVSMQEQYVKSYNGQYQHLIEKLKPARQIIEQIEANKEGKSIEERMKDLERVYEILNANSKRSTA